MTSWTGSPIIVSPNFGEDCDGFRFGKNKIRPLRCLKEQPTSATPSVNESIQLSHLTERGHNPRNQRATTNIGDQDKERKKRRKSIVAAVVLILATLVALLIVILSWKLLAQTDSQTNSPQNGREDRDESRNTPPLHRQTSLVFSAAVNQGVITSTARLKVKQATSSATTTIVTKEESKLGGGGHRITLYSSDATATATHTSQSNGQATSSFTHIRLRMEFNTEFSHHKAKGKEFRSKESRTSPVAVTFRKYPAHYSSCNYFRGSGISTSFSDKKGNKETTNSWSVQKTLAFDSDHITSASEASNPPRSQSRYGSYQKLKNYTSSVPSISLDKSVENNRGYTYSSNNEVEETTPSTTASYGTVLESEPSPGLASVVQPSRPIAHNLESFTGLPTIFQSKTVELMKFSSSQPKKDTSLGISKATSDLVFAARASQSFSTKLLWWNVVTLRATPVMNYNSVKNTKAMSPLTEIDGIPYTRDIKETAKDSALFANDSPVGGERSQETILLTEKRREVSTKPLTTTMLLLVKATIQAVILPSHLISLSASLQTSVKIRKTQEQGEASIKREIILGGKTADTEKKAKRSSTTKVFQWSSSRGLAESRTSCVAETSRKESSRSTSSSNLPRGTVRSTSISDEKGNNVKTTDSGILEKTLADDSGHNGDASKTSNPPRTQSATYGSSSRGPVKSEETSFEKTSYKMEKTLIYDSDHNGDASKTSNPSSTQSTTYGSSSRGLVKSEATSFEKTPHKMVETPTLGGTASSNYHMQSKRMTSPAAAVVLASCTKMGYFPHPHDCSKYIRCVGGNRRYAMTCPAGTLFDPKTKICQHRKQVKCNNNF